ncbi:MAG: hypothetical protein LBD46_06545 [Endomicrobium sp.]|jgi:hypothetical protein|nr:hypothetical protein [Endomicrobium sp.]
MADETISGLPEAPSAADEQVFPVEDGISTKKMTLAKLGAFLGNKFNNAYAPKKADAGSWIMNNGIWVSGYNKAEIDNLLNNKFTYRAMPANTNPTTLADGAYRWTWNSGGTGMPFTLSGNQRECSCIVINGSRTLSIRSDTDLVLEFYYSSNKWMNRGTPFGTFSPNINVTLSTTEDSTLFPTLPEDHAYYFLNLRLSYNNSNSTNCTYIFMSGGFIYTYSLRSDGSSSGTIYDSLQLMCGGGYVDVILNSGQRKAVNIVGYDSLYFRKQQ